jgi:multidrug efflux pump subunit AcrA (membrane-fusion protein)
MVHSSSATSAVTQKNVIGLSVLFLVLAAIFGALNSNKVKALRTNVANAEAASLALENRRVTQRQDLKPRKATGTGEEDKVAEAESKAAKAEADLAQSQKEKADLQTRLDANQSETASLRKRVEEAEKAVKPSETPAAAAVAGSVAELQAQLDDARRQLDSAEKEKVFLSEKLQSAQERSAPPQEERKRRETGTRRTGVRGTVLAVNQAYNFVVLNLGARHGVEPNSEMLVLREGTLIGKIRISSVEPATAIGDIITGSLARGVQVQPGDTVIYAGTSS